MGIITKFDLLGFERSKSEGIEFLNKEKSNIKKKIGVINIMPSAVRGEVEYQYLTILGRYPSIDIEIEFLYPEKDYAQETRKYIKSNNIPLKELNNRNYDGLVLTGAPFEDIDFEEVSYWKELKLVFESKLPTIYICWGSQAGLYANHGVEKHLLKEKVFGVFKSKVFENPFITSKTLNAVYSRNSKNLIKDIESCKDLVMIAKDDSEVYMCGTLDYKKIYITGHGEYQKERLDYEYKRDLKNIPPNYYKNDDPNKEILFSWDKHREEFYRKWLISL